VRYAIGVDLGGTNFKAVAVTEDGEILDRVDGESRGEDDRLAVERIRKTVRELEGRRGGPAAWIGIGAPGLAAPDGRSIAWMQGRLAGLQGLVWADRLEARVPVVVTNDAQAALLGEAWKGAARGLRDAVLLTLGTGVGGAILREGRIVRGHLGRAGHWGHISLDPEGAPSITGMPGSLEEAVGSSSLAARSKGRFHDARELVAAHRAGDEEATEIWMRSVRALGRAIGSIVNAVDPEAVILGGGIALAGPALFEPLARVLDEIEWRPTGGRVRVLAAELGEAAGALGAARAAMGERPGDAYLARARSLVDVVSAQLPAIRQAAEWFAETIAGGRMVHVFGAGHSRMLVEEMWPRYGSFPGFNPIVELSLTYHNPVVGPNGQRQAMFLENVPGLAERILRNFDLRREDSALVASSSGAGVVAVEMAEGFRRRGIRVVAIVSRAHAEATETRHPRGVRLLEVADLVLDTGAPRGDAMVTIPGLDTPVAPGSTVGGALVVNVLKAEVAARLVEKGHPPRVLTAAAVVGRERSEALFESAYDEHARRLAALYAGLGRRADAGPEKDRTP
jgi:predicted NBD/HSP70 family sugar kinase/uncharacterized phosphosugar-binding protein